MEVFKIKRESADLAQQRHDKVLTDALNRVQSALDGARRRDYSREMRKLSNLERDGVIPKTSVQILGKNFLV